MGDAGKAVGGRVPAFEDEDGSEAIVGEVVHAGNEDAVVRREGEESHAVEAGSGDMDVEGIRQGEGDGSSGRVRESARGLGGGKRRQERKEKAEWGAKAGAAHSLV